MANYTTGSQRRNKRMDEIFEEAKRLKKDPSVKSFKRHQVKIGMAYKDKGDQYPGAKSKALAKKKGDMGRENVAGKPNALKRLFDSLPERDKQRR